MYYVMRYYQGVPVRYGRMQKNPQAAVAAARRFGHGAWVECYGIGVVWTPILGGSNLIH